MSQLNTSSALPSSDIPSSQVGPIEDNKHTQLHIITDPNHSSLSSSPSSSPQILINVPPESPVNRKRTEGESQDVSSNSADHHPSQKIPEYVDGSSESSFPPFKKPKPSLPLSQANLTAYRSSQDMADDPFSPQTSPVLEPTSPSTSISSVNTRSHKRPPPTNSGVTGIKGIPIVPFLTRSRTLEEIKPSIQSSITESSETAIESLSLGSRASEAITKPVGVERTMGVITTSRQSSPSLAFLDTKSREPTPMHMEEENSQQCDVNHTSSQNYRHIRSLTGSMSASEEIEGSLDAQMLGGYPDSASEYDEEADNDYEPGADTTIDEDFARVDTSESEDDDSFSNIDLKNIEPSINDKLFEDVPYHDVDPLCLDRLTEEEKMQIMDEARKFGIAYIIQEYIMTGVHTVKKLLLMTTPEELKISASLTEADLVCIFSQRMERELKHRQRLQHVHTLEHVIELLKNSQKIMILTGAGVSVSCGIPDFRSPDGVYSRLSEFELDDPTQMFEFEFFSEKPEVFYSFAREIFPSNFTPSSSHNFIKLLEDQGRLLRNYTQNIDTLEQKAGIQNVLQCHGSFATASCIRCKFQVPGDEIKDAILKQQVAYCKHCASSNSNHGFNSTETSREQGTDIEDSNRDGTEPAVMKPDIVFFGERLPSAFDDCFEKDRNEVDLLIVIGSSLKVAPVSDIMHQLPKNIPQILINRTPITHMEFDVQLLGNCDTIVAELCRMAGWELRHERLPGGTSNVPNMGMNTNADGSGRGGRAYWSLIEPNTYIFEGAILGDIEYESSQSGSKKRGCFDHCVVDDYGISSDEDEESQRRTSFLRVGRFSSPGVMDMDSDDGNSDGGSNDSGSDSDSDSNESQHTVRSISIVPTNSGTSNSAIDSVICPSLVTPSDMASEAIGSRCSVPDIRAGTSSSPSLPSSQEEPCARRQPHEERDDKSKLRATLEGRTPQGASKIELESIVESGGTRSPSHDYNCAHEIRQLSVDSDLVFDDSLKATILLQQDGNVVSQVINELPGQSSLITEPMEENIDHGHKC